MIYLLALIFSLAMVADAQSLATELTLETAERMALENHPRIRSAEALVEAAGAATLSERANRSPLVNGNLTAVAAISDTRIGAGGLNPSSLISRVAGGVRVSQLISDFGRTSSLISAADLREKSREKSARSVRAATLLRVRAAFFAVLRAEAMRSVADETVKTRSLRLKQISTLVENKLRSTLDRTFAETSLSESELLLAEAGNAIQEAHAELEAALGRHLAAGAKLVEPASSLPLNRQPETFVEEAMSQRPAILALQLESEAAGKAARAERLLSRPTLSAQAVGGAIPFREEGVRAQYGAVGIDVAIPLFDGKRFSARADEAEARARAVAEDLDAARQELEREVRVAWLRADTAWRRIGLTRKLLKQSREALQLAQSRYDLGLGSIVELNQAQLSRTTAEIDQVAARYDYEISLSTLAFAAGARR